MRMLLVLSKHKLPTEDSRSKDDIDSAFSEVWLELPYGSEIADLGGCFAAL